MQAAGSLPLERGAAGQTAAGHLRHIYGVSTNMVPKNQH